MIGTARLDRVETDTRAMLDAQRRAAEEVAAAAAAVRTAALLLSAVLATVLVAQALGPGRR